MNFKTFSFFFAQKINSCYPFSLISGVHSLTHSRRFFAILNMSLLDDLSSGSLLKLVSAVAIWKEIVNRVHLDFSHTRGDLLSYPRYGQNIRPPFLIILSGWKGNTTTSGEFQVSLSWFLAMTDCLYLLRWVKDQGCGLMGKADGAATQVQHVNFLFFFC